MRPPEAGAPGIAPASSSSHATRRARRSKCPMREASRFRPQFSTVRVKRPHIAITIFCRRQTLPLPSRQQQAENSGICVGSLDSTERKRCWLPRSKPSSRRPGRTTRVSSTPCVATMHAPLPFFEEATGPALWISLLPNERWGLVVHAAFLATLNALGRRECIWIAR